MVEVKSITRSVKGLSDPSAFDGMEGAEMVIRSKATVVTYQTNPFLESPDQPAELVGVVGNRVIGKVGTMPMLLWADGKEYRTSANPDIKVDPEFRKTGYAFDLFEFGTAASPDGIKADFYVSRQARGVMRMLGSIVFDIRQFAVVRDASLFFARRLPRGFAHLGCWIMNVVFAVHRVLLGLLVGWKTRGWKFEKAGDDASIASFVGLIRQDGHRFKPSVSESFYKWLLAQDFMGVEVADKHLWKVTKAGELIGYVIARRDGTGRGRIIDWQTPVGGEKNYPWLLMAAARKCLRSCKAVVISVSSRDAAVVSGLKRFLPRLPLQAATVSASKGSPLLEHEGWQDDANWRIRPTMGDSGLY